MKESLEPTLRAAALTAFVAGVAYLLLDPPSLDGFFGLLVIIGIAAGIAVILAWATVRLAGEEMPEAEFRRLVDRSDLLATLPPPALPPSPFDDLVIAALDGLPERFQEVLEHTPVLVSLHGDEVGAYGHYMGGTIARDYFPDRIIIYEDTLTRDFGHNPALLRAQVERTVRHEVAHHLGWDESGVQALGL